MIPKLHQYRYRMKIVKRMLDGKAGKVLDIGCFSNFLEKEFPEFDYVGLDLKRYNPSPKKFVRHNLDENPKLPFANNSFDFVICTEVLEHLLYPQKICQEIRRILKPTGFAIISLPNEFTVFERGFLLSGRNVMAEAGHKTIFDVKRARNFMKENFDVIEEEYFPAAEF